MSIDYKKIYLYSESILIRKFSGAVNVDEIIDSWEYLINNNMLSAKQKGVINDLSRCKLDMDMEGFTRIVSYLKSKELFKSIKLAVVTDSQEKIVFPLMGEMQVTELKIKVFATLEGAVDWIIY
jgi:hypothetical protein